ncbi:alpha-1,2-fucosyltransferase, partial [Bacteroides fragilis]
MKGVPDGIPYYKEPFHEFSRIPYEEGKDLIIDGYFQSEKYFKRSVVLDLYRITDELRKKIWNICGNILEKGETVSIHVRRGDYLKLPHALPFCGKSYYKNAIQYIGEDKIFIIC